MMRGCEYGVYEDTLLHSYRHTVVIIILNACLLACFSCHLQITAFKYYGPGNQTKTVKCSENELLVKL